MDEAQSGGWVELSEVHAVAVHQAAVPPLPSGAPSTWGITRKGWRLRWVMDPPVSGFVITDAHGRAVLLHTAVGRPSEASEQDPYYAALGFSRTLSSTVDTDGDMPDAYSSRDGRAQERIYGWAQVRRLHQVALELPNGAGGPEVARALGWADLAPQAAQRWQDAGCEDPVKARQYSDGGLRAEQAGAWAVTPYNDEEVTDLLRAGWTVEQGQRLLDPAHFGNPKTYDALKARKRWVRSKVPAEVVLLCLAAGVSLKEYRADRPSEDVLNALAALKTGS